MDKVLKLEDVDLRDVIYDNPIKTSSGEYIISKIWHRPNKNTDPKTLNIQLPYTKVYKVSLTNKTFDVILIPDATSEDFLENVDKLTWKFMKEKHLIHKYDLKNYKYKTLINELEYDDGKKLNVIRIKVIQDKKKQTVFFSSKTKNIVELDDAKNIIQLVDNIKVIFELDALIIDVSKKLIMTNIIARHILLHELTPKKIDLSEYSFLDSDNDEKKCQPILYDEDLILNAQTEYVNDSTEENDENRHGKKNDDVESSNSSENEYFENGHISETTDSDE